MESILMFGNFYLILTQNGDYTHPIRTKIKLISTLVNCTLSTSIIELYKAVLQIKLANTLTYTHTHTIMLALYPFKSRWFYPETIHELLQPLKQWFRLHTLILTEAAFQVLKHVPSTFVQKRLHISSWLVHCIFCQYVYSTMITNGNPLLFFLQWFTTEIHWC
jgi:hypothetical protein